MWILGYDVHLLWTVLVLFVLFMVVIDSVIHLYEDRLPLVLLEIFRYGKALNGPVQSELVRWIEVPKSWFLHFYIFASIYSTCILLLVHRTYIGGRSVPESVLRTLDSVCTESRPVSTRQEPVYLVLVLLTVQCYRRLYECAFVNAKSTSTMNVLHYVVGFAHYYSTTTGIICEAPVFAHGEKESVFSITELFTLKHAVCVLLFLWSWVHQYRAHVIFADLKKKRGTKHGVPQGDLFNLVSCPHYLCEVLIYAVFVMMLGVGHLTMDFVFVWVLVNQVVAALMSHSWYLNKFNNYPKQRKAIIPYIL